MTDEQTLEDLLDRAGEEIDKIAGVFAALGLSAALSSELLEPLGAYLAEIRARDAKYPGISDKFEKRGR